MSSVVKLADHVDMTTASYRGRKSATQHNNNNNNKIKAINVQFCFISILKHQACRGCWGLLMNIAPKKRKKKKKNKKKDYDDGENGQ